MRKCIQCGKREEFKEHLCRECYLQENPIIKKINPFSVTKCIRCNRIKISQKGLIPVSEGLKKELIKNIKLNLDYKFKDILFNAKEEKNTLLVDFVIKAEIDSKKVEEPYSMVLPLKKIVCSECGNKNPKYFEGILQIRCKRSQTLQEIMKEILEKSKIVNSESLKKQDNGFDIQFRDISQIRKLVEELKKKFKGYSRYSNEVFSKNTQTSKDILRTNIKYVASPFKKGDVIKLDDGYYKVEKTEPLMLWNIEKNELKHFNQDLAEKEFKFLEPQECQIIKLIPEIEVLDPNTFKEAEVINPSTLKKSKVKAGDYVKVIMVKERGYILELKKDKEGRERNRKT